MGPGARAVWPGRKTGILETWDSGRDGPAGGAWLAPGYQPARFPIAETLGPFGAKGPARCAHRISPATNTMSGENLMRFMRLGMISIKLRAHARRNCPSGEQADVSLAEMPKLKRQIPIRRWSPTRRPTPQDRDEPMLMSVMRPPSANDAGRLEMQLLSHE